MPAYISKTLGAIFLFSIILIGAQVLSVSPELPPSFEDAYQNSGKQTIDYLEPEAFSPLRLKEGKAVFEAKCAVCHSDSGRDMVMFGNPDFYSNRVIGSVKKFAGATDDPEVGEKVYEYLRYYHLGPFMSQHQPFLQPGPFNMDPGSSNPVLTNPDDFWGALTGHRIPTPEDIEIDKVWDSYQWTRVIVPFKLLSWSEFLPHSVPLPEAQKAARELFQRQNYDLGKLPLPDQGLGRKFNNGAIKIFNQYQFSSHDKEKTDHSSDFTEGVYASSFLNWLSVLDYEYGLPRWQNGSWNETWAFGPLETPILWKTGTSLIHLNMHAINPNEKRDSRALNRNQWTHYPNMFVTGKGEVFKPATNFTGATMPWSCKTGDAGRFGGQDIQIFTGLKHFAELWHHSQIYPEAQYPGVKLDDYGTAVRRHLLAIDTPYRGMRNYKFDKKVLVNILLEVVYRQWKASIGATDLDLRTFYGTSEYEANEKEEERWKALTSAYESLQNTLTPRQQDFVKAYIRRLYPVSPEKFSSPFKPYKWELFEEYPVKPVLLPFGSGTAIAGKPYRLRILRSQAGDGEIEITTAGSLPAGAKLVKLQGNWKTADYDYQVEWTPTREQANRSYTITFKGTSNLGMDETTATIQVLKKSTPPVLESIPDQYVFVGQELTFPLTVQNSDVDILTFRMEGDFGRFFNNAWNTAGIYTVKPAKTDVGIHRITYTVTDQSGHQSSTIAKIKVYDNDPPAVSISPTGTGPGSNKNIYHVKVGATLRFTIDVFDPDGDPVEISKNPDFPGYINGNIFSYTVEEDLARNFPGPNVLTFAARDLESTKNDPYRPKYKGGETFKVLLVYFESSGANPNHTPWAITGPNPSVQKGSLVNLNGTGSDDTDGDPITYHWEQVAGPPVKLANQNTAKPTFTAPNVTNETILKFYLTVTDPGGLSDQGVVRVKVSP